MGHKNYSECHTTLLHKLSQCLISQPSPNNLSPANCIYVQSLLVYIHALQWAYIYLPSSVFLFTFSCSHFPTSPLADHVSPLPDGVCLYNTGLFRCHIHSRSILLSPCDAAIVSVVMPPRPQSQLRVCAIQREAISAVSL